MIFASLENESATHCKDVARSEPEIPVDEDGRGIIDYAASTALKKDGYRGVVSLETHWRGAARPKSHRGKAAQE
jgi:hypothetical protein